MLDGDVLFTENKKLQNFADALKHELPLVEVTTHNEAAKLATLFGESNEAEDLDLNLIAKLAQAEGASALMLSLFHEAYEDRSESVAIVNGKRVSTTAASKYIESKSPSLSAYQAIDGDGRSVKKLKRLLEDGVNASSRVYKRSLIYVAAINAYRSAEYVELLLEHGASPDEIGCAWEWAPQHGKPDYLTPIAGMVADFDTGHDAREIRNACTAIHALLAAGANPDDAGPTEKTSLLLVAINRSFYGAVKLLIDAGADVLSAHPVYNVTPLSLAVSGYSDRIGAARRPDRKKIIQVLLTLDERRAITDYEGNPLGQLKDVLPEALTW